MSLLILFLISEWISMVVFLRIVFDCFWRLLKLFVRNGISFCFIGLVLLIGLRSFLVKRRMLMVNGFGGMFFFSFLLFF